MGWEPTNFDTNRGPWEAMTKPEAITLSVAQASDITSLSEYEIRKAINKAELPAVRRGSRLLIFRTDLEAWLRGHDAAVEPTGAA